jgi:hypothetical protein
MSVTVKNCLSYLHAPLLIRETRRVLPVDVDTGQSVRELLEEIKAENPDIIHGETKNLELFLAKTADNEWLNEEDAAAVPLDGDGSLQGFEQLDPTLPLDNVKYLGDNFQLRDGQIGIYCVGAAPGSTDGPGSGERPGCSQGSFRDFIRQRAVHPTRVLGPPRDHREEVGRGSTSQTRSRGR